MAELTTEGHFVFTILDEVGRRRISNTLLDDGTIVVYIATGGGGASFPFIERNMKGVSRGIYV